MLSIKDEHYLRVSALQCATQIVSLHPVIIQDTTKVIAMAEDFLEFLKCNEDKEVLTD